MPEEEERRLPEVNPEPEKVQFKSLTRILL